MAIKYLINRMRAHTTLITHLQMLLLRMGRRLREAMLLRTCHMCLQPIRTILIIRVSRHNSRRRHNFICHNPIWVILNVKHTIFYFIICKQNIASLLEFRFYSKCHRGYNSIHLFDRLKNKK